MTSIFASISLWIRVKILRFLFNLNDRKERRQEPAAPDATFVETIATSGRTVSLHFYTPPGFEKKSSRAVSRPRRPLVIDFHGGGFTVGSPSIDARFASVLLNLKDVEPVVVSVDYGLAPETPFPGAVEDAAIAITWLATEGAERYNLDASRIVLTGFSAGGSLVFAAPMWLQQNPGLHVLPHPLKGIVSVYPGLDWRSEIGGPPPTGIARFMSETWKDAFYRRSPLHDPYISIAAAEDDVLHALPQRIGLYPVEKDPLRAGAEQFEERLRRMGKTVSGMVEPGVGHAWDKYPVTSVDVHRKRDEWFQRIAQDVKHMLQD